MFREVFCSFSSARQIREKGKGGRCEGRCQLGGWWVWVVLGLVRGRGLCWVKYGEGSEGERACVVDAKREACSLIPSENQKIMIGIWERSWIFNFVLSHSFGVWRLALTLTLVLTLVEWRMEEREWDLLQGDGKERY